MIFNAFTDAQVLSPFQIFYSYQLWPNGDTETIPELSNLAVGQDLICLDIEHWQDPERYIQTMQRFHELYPGKRAGFYGVLPKRNYWQAITGQSDAGYKDWQSGNDAFSDIAKESDILFPSLYTFYDDEENWIRYATENILEARRFGETVIPFLWPVYHDSTELSGQYIPGKFWEQQLKTVLSLCGSVVIWGSPLEPSGEWFDITSRYL